MDRGISDNITVYGATENEHEERLRNFLHIARKEGLRLNSNKCVIRVQQISLFGRLHTSQRHCVINSRRKMYAWQWQEDHQSIFEKTKQLVGANVCLQYYDPTAEVHLEVDAPIKGLGATLVQINNLSHSQAKHNILHRHIKTILHASVWLWSMA